MPSRRFALSTKACVAPTAIVGFAGVKCTELIIKLFKSEPMHPANPSSDSSGKICANFLRLLIKCELQNLNSAKHEFRAWLARKKKRQMLRKIQMAVCWESTSDDRREVEIARIYGPRFPSG